MTATRKHFYLITEHNRDEEKVGLFKILDTRSGRSAKNEETPYHALDKEEGDFYVAGKQVSLGYVDFESEEDYEVNAAEAIDRKLAEIDEKWLRKAGHDPEEVGE